MSARDTRTRVLLAVMRQRHPSVRSIAAEVGLSVATCHKHLDALRRDGLVQWSWFRAGTLRATCSMVPLSRSKRR